MGLGEFYCNKKRSQGDEKLPSKPYSVDYSSEKDHVE